MYDSFEQIIEVWKVCDQDAFFSETDHHGKGLPVGSPTYARVVPLTTRSRTSRIVSPTISEIIP